MPPDERRELVLAALDRREPLSTAEIAHALGIPSDNLGCYLIQYERAGVLVGEWAPSLRPSHHRRYKVWRRARRPEPFVFVA